jgi:hypothetical protein
MAFMTPDTTVCLLNWKRPDNLPIVVGAVASQRPSPTIYLWNNGAPIVQPGVDWYVASSINRRCWPRWYMAAFAPTEFVCVLDDDLCFADPHVLRDMKELLLDSGQPNTIVGPCGVTLIDGLSYRAARHVHPFRGEWKDAACDIVKGRCMLLRRHDLVTRVALSQYADEPDDDIIVSAALASGRRGQHICAASLGKRFHLLPESHALKDEAEHWTRRGKCCNKHFGTRLAVE